MSSHKPHQDDEEMDAEEEEQAMLDPDEAGEEIVDDGDVAMDSDEDEGQEEIQLQNDSVAHFDLHTDSIFCIAQHPICKNIVATGGGDDVGYVWDSSTGKQEKPVLPASYETDPQPSVGRESIQPIMKLDGHTDSVNAITFSKPHGNYLLTAGLDGKLRAYVDPMSSPTKPGNGQQWKFLAEAQEVEEINWLAACPSSSHPNMVALGASDGSVWLYTVDAADKSSPLTIQQAFYLHTAPCTAGAWSPDGALLATVAEDSSLYVWDAFGDAAAAGLASSAQGGQAVVSLTDADERFRVEGGLYSAAVAPNGSFVAVGGAGGHIRVVGLPRVGPAATASATAGQKGAGAKSKAGGGKQAGGPKGASSGAGQAGTILANLQAQGDSVESIAFAQASGLTLMAAASVDGSIALFDWQHNFAVRRHIKESHEGEAVIKVEFAADSTMLTSCGNDGVVRVWDSRGGTAAAAQGLVREWKGHRGGGEGGGVLGFVQDESGRRVVTAGDDGVGLVFEA